MEAPSAARRPRWLVRRRSATGRRCGRRGSPAASRGPRRGRRGRPCGWPCRCRRGRSAPPAWPRRPAPGWLVPLRAEAAWKWTKSDPPPTARATTAAAAAIRRRRAAAARREGHDLAAPRPQHPRHQLRRAVRLRQGAQLRLHPSGEGELGGAGGAAVQVATQARRLLRRSARRPGRARGGRAPPRRPGVHSVASWCTSSFSRSRSLRRPRWRWTRTVASGMPRASPISRCGSPWTSRRMTMLL